MTLFLRALEHSQSFCGKASPEIHPLFISIRATVLSLRPNASDIADERQEDARVPERDLFSRTFLRASSILGNSSIASARPSYQASVLSGTINKTNASYSLLPLDPGALHILKQA